MASRSRVSGAESAPDPAQCQSLPGFADTSGARRGLHLLDKVPT